MSWIKNIQTVLRGWFFVVIVGGSVALAAGGVADNQVNPYTEKQDTFEISHQSITEGAGENKIELVKNQPKVVFNRWNGEVKMGVRYTEIQATGARALLTNRIEWKSAKQEMHGYPIQGAGMEDGGFEIEIMLNQKPTKNTFDFVIDGADQLDFFYQPPLTVDIGNGAIVSATETEAFNKDGRRIEYQPENVVGSYAVYHKVKRDYAVGQTNYATGKAYHIYRPKAIDANGIEAWAGLSYQNEVLTVTVPQSFLDSAAYPVTVDPTFGYTSIGAGDDAWLVNDTIGYGQDSGNNLTEDGTITKLTLYAAGDSGTQNVKGVIYNAGAPPGARRGITDPSAFTTTPNWVDLTFATPVALTAGQYVITWVPDGNTTAKKDNTAGYTRYTATGSYASPPDPFPSTAYTSTASRRGSMYATYTVAAAARKLHQQGIIIFE